MTKARLRTGFILFISKNSRMRNFEKHSEGPLAMKIWNMCCWNEVVYGALDNW